MHTQVPTLKSPAAFRKVYEKGQKEFSKKALIVFIKSNKLKIGVVISRKQGGAVVRNRAKRLVKEFFRLNKDAILPASVVVVLRAPLLSSYKETHDTMLKLLYKAGLINEKNTGFFD